MPQVLVGTTANDGTGDPLRTAFLKVNQYGILNDKTINAAFYKTSSNTNEAAITLAIVAAALLGTGAAVWVPASMLPYNASLVTFNTAVNMLREGGNPTVYDIRAYGFGFGGAGDAAALAACAAAADSATAPSYTAYMPSQGVPFGMDVWGAMFNGQRDDTFAITYNQLLGGAAGPQGKVLAGEPDFHWIFETHYYDGVSRWIELNWDITSADGNVANNRRAISCQYNRATYGTGWLFEVVRDGTGQTGWFVVTSKAGSRQQFIFDPAPNGSDGSNHDVQFRMYSSLFQLGEGGGAAAPSDMQFGPEVTAAGVGLHIALAAPAYFLGKGFANARTVPAYGVNVVIDASGGNVFEIVPSNGTGFTVNIPTNAALAATTSQPLVIRIKNTFGVLGAATFTAGAGGYRLGAAWTQPANGFSKSITFRSDGVNWIETDRSAVDVAN